MNRRAFIQGTAIATSAAAAVIAPQTAAPAEPKSQEGKDITQTLAKYLVTARFEDFPASVRAEVSRSLLNWMGVAVGGSHHEAVEIALSAVAPFAGPPQAGVLGRKDRVDIMSAALLNGISSHVFDFDDTT